MHTKPKSAPPRIVSKFVSTKSNALKEMEAWAKRMSDPMGSNVEASRMSGQLVDNVTEERMLKAKLWELSKERYKFLSQNAYEKKVFVDRMHRKSSVISRRINQCESGMVDRQDGKQTGKTKRLNARLAFLDRMDPKKGRDRPKELKEYEKSIRIPIITEVTPISRSGESLKSLLEGRRQIGPKLPALVNTASAVTAASSKLVTSVGRDGTDGGVKSWAVKRAARKYGSTGSMVRDPRYEHLEHMLTPIKNYQTSSCVKDLVENIDCLHLAPKRPKQPKGHTGIKVMAFMKERGFAF